MSTEQKPAATPTPPANPAHNEAKPEPNALAKSLSSGWEQFTQGKLISYKWMAIILLVVAAIGTTWWIVSAKRSAEAAKWMELDGLPPSPTALEEYARKNPNTKQAKLAELEIARIQLEPEGIDRLAADRPDVRKNAVASVEKARESLIKLVDDFKDDPLLKVVCLLGAAKAEAALVGMLKEGSLDQYYGDPAKAVEWLDKVAEAAPDTDWGKDAKKLADSLRNMNTKQQVVELQRSVYLMPTLPGFGGKMPKDDIHGGLGGLGGLGGPIGPDGPGGFGPP